MIKGFKDKRLAAIAEGKSPKGFPPELVRRTHALLTVLNAVHDLDDLRSPPGNQLERLSGDRAAQHSIRVNRQFRICFVWTDGGPENVELVDYH